MIFFVKKSKNKIVIYMLGFFRTIPGSSKENTFLVKKSKIFKCIERKKKLAAAADPASPSHLPHFLFKKRRSNYDV